jgi:hypothetical protein
MPLISQGGGAYAPAGACGDVAFADSVQPRSLLLLVSVAVGSGQLVHSEVVATGSLWREATRPLLIRRPPEHLMASS